ncbi:MAG: hypothetical protein P1U63_13220 [Coxiellaceae bacterium]|nr:hypothetical protein [Coxiellaceae bacterium]
MRYKSKLQHIERTFEYVQNNPNKAKVLGHGLLKRFNNHLDSDLFNILSQLQSLGYGRQIAAILAGYQKEAAQLKNSSERLWRRNRSLVHNTNPAPLSSAFDVYEDQKERHMPTLIKGTQLALVQALEKFIDDRSFAIDTKPRVKLKQSIRRYSRKHEIDLHDDTHHIDKTFDYVAQNPFKVVMFGQGVLKHFNDNLNKHLFEALYQMHLVGLHKQLPDLLQRYKKAAKDLEDKKDREWSDQALAAYNANPKLSSGVIHNNLAKIGHKDLEQAKKTLLVQMYWELAVQNQQYMDAASGKAIKQSLNRYAREQVLACRIEVVRKQALYKDGEKSLRKVYEFRDSTGYSPDATKQKAKERGWKKWFQRVALGIAITVGIGEALVAVVFAGLPLLVGALAIGIPAFLVNFYLLKGAASGTLKEVFLGRFFKNQYGETVSKGKKIAISAASIFVVAAGLCYGVLSFGSALSGLGGLFFGLTAAASLAAPPLGLMVLAGFVATVTAVAITTLFYVSVADFIKNDRAQQLGRYYRKTGSEIAQHWKEGKYGHAVGRVLWEGCKALFVVGLTSLVTLCSFGKFHGKTLSLMTSFFRSPGHTASKVGYVVSALAAPVNSLFAGRSMELTRKLIGSAASYVGRKVRGFAKSIKAFFSKKEKSTASADESKAVKAEVSPIACYAQVKAKVTMGVLVASTVANAQAQAGGMSTDTGIGSKYFQHQMAYAYYPGQFAYSGSPNYDACRGECAEPVNRQTVAEGKQAEAKALADRQLQLATLDSDMTEQKISGSLGSMVDGRGTPSPVSSTEMSSSDESVVEPFISVAQKKAQVAGQQAGMLQDQIKQTELKRRQDLGLFGGVPSSGAYQPPVVDTVNEVKQQDAIVEEQEKPNPWRSKVALFGSMDGYSTENPQLPAGHVVSAAA